MVPTGPSVCGSPRFAGQAKATPSRRGRLQKSRGEASTTLAFAIAAACQ